MNNAQQINEIEIFSEFIIEFNRSNKDREIINGWSKDESPDFLYYLNNKEIGLELTELVFQEEKYKLKLSLTEVEFPVELKGNCIVLFQKNDDIPNRNTVKEIKNEVIKFLSAPGRLFSNEYDENKFKDYRILHDNIKKINIISGKHNQLDISLNQLITAQHVHNDFEDLVKKSIESKVEKSSKYKTDEVHVLLYTDLQTDINDGPTFDIIYDFLREYEMPKCKISRVYLFLRWKRKFYIFDF
jgi:hypothetical protein